MTPQSPRAAFRAIEMERADAPGTACQCPGSHRMPGRCPGPEFCPMCDAPTDEDEESDDA